MKRSVWLLLSLGVMFSACKDEVDTVPNRTIFTFTSASLTDAAFTDYWVVVVDNSSGNFIDAKKLAINTELVFESTRPISNNMIDVTIFQTPPNGTTGNSIATVYTGIPLGAQWVYPQGRPYSYPDNGGILGAYTLKVTGVPALLTLDVSDAFGIVGTPGYSFSGGTATMTAKIHGNASSQMVSIDTGIDKPKYTTVKDLAIGKTVTVDYSTFNEFNRYLTLSFPETGDVEAKAMGYQQGASINWSSFAMQEYNYDNPNDGASLVKRNELNIGLLDSLPQYSIDIVIGGAMFEYISLGPAPASIAYVDPGLYKASGTTLDDYTITSSAGFDYRQTSFSYKRGSMSIYADYYVAQGTEFKHHDPIGPDLVGKYGIDVSKLRYEGTQFSNGLTYNLLLKYYFDPSFDQLTPWQETTIYCSADQ